MRHLHWFQNDLRLVDNPVLLYACGATSLLCIYLLPRPRPWCNLSGIGPQRDRFIRESLQALKAALQALGQDLMVLEGSPELVIPQIVERFSIDVVSTPQTPGWYESQTLAFLRDKLSVPLIVDRGNTLFSYPLPGKTTPIRSHRSAERSRNSPSRRRMGRRRHYPHLQPLSLMPYLLHRHPPIPACRYRVDGLLASDDSTSSSFRKRVSSSTSSHAMT